MKWAEKTAFFAVVGLGLLMMVASQTTPGPREPKPKFTNFSLSPTEVCLNWGVPVVTVNYTIDPDGWNNQNTLCTKLRFHPNGPFLHVTQNHQCLNAGTSGIASFNVLVEFGNAPPSVITVQGQLNPSVAGEVFDTVTASVKTANCAEPGLFP